MALRNRRRSAAYLVILAGLLAIVWASFRSFSTSQIPEKSLGDLLTALDEKQVASSTFTSEGDRVDWIDTAGQPFRTNLTSSYADTLVDRFHHDGLGVNVTPSSASNLLLSVILPNAILFLVIGGFMWYMLRRTGARLIS
jgi:ATP-dependent Zn protease